jgi:hypothetical protein
MKHLQHSLIAGVLAGICSQPAAADFLADGSEFQVNSYTTGRQSVYYFKRSVSKTPDGRFVVVWRDDRNGDVDVYGKVYGADGQATGDDFLVNEYTTGGQGAPSVQTRPDGSFVVAWSSYAGQDGDYGSVQGRVFGADGTPEAGEFQINTYTTDNQSDARLCSAADGSFVIAWQSRNQDGADWGIFGQRYDSAGAPVGGEIAINQYTTSTQSGAQISCAADGRFVVAWTSTGQDGDGNGAEARRFASDGTPLGPEFQVNSSSAGHQYVHDVEGPGDGSFVVVGLSQFIDGDAWGVAARRFDTSGAPIGASFRVNTYTPDNQNHPSVAAAADGSFVVVWHAYLQDGDGSGVYGQAYDPAGVPAGGEFLVNTYTTSYQGYPAVSSDAAGNFVVVWTSQDQDGSNQGVFGQRYCVDADDDLVCDAPVSEAGTLKSGSEFQVNTYTTGNQSVYYMSRAVSKMPDGRFVVVWVDERNGDDDVYGKRFAADGSAIGTDFRVNAYTTGAQAAASVQARPDGSFVVAWSSYAGQDGDYASVQGRVFDANGTPVADEFQVNTYTTNNQTGARLCSAQDGSFVIVWQSRDEDGANWGIFGQRYDSAATPVGSELAINQYTTSTQTGAHVTCAAGGGFAVAWTSFGQDGDGHGVEARRYASDGTPLGPEFQVNSSSAGHQYAHDIEGPGDGSFVVVGLSQDIDGDPWGVAARGFDTDGVPTGPSFRVNTHTADTQNFAAVAAAPDGGFVVVWHAYPQDGDGAGIYAQSYDPAGVAVGGEFLVNTYTTGYQNYPAVASDAGGNFVMVWSSSGQDGSGQGVFGQRYCRDADDDVSCDGSYLPDVTDEPVAPGGAVTTDPENDGATPSDPIETYVTSPNGGTVSIAESVVSASPAVIEISISAPAATAANPLILQFRIDATMASSYTIKRNGVDIGLDCTGTPGTADPDPCLDNVATQPDGDHIITVLTSAASVWRLEGAAPGICPATPATGCLTGAASSVQIKNDATTSKNQIKWKLKAAEAFDQAALGNPAMTRAYALCVYDHASGTPELVSTVRIDANASWESKDPKGYAYKDKEGLEDGVTKATLRTGLAGRSSVAVSAKGALIPMPAPLDSTHYFEQNTKVVVQLVNGETSLCWTSEFTSAIKNDGSKFSAKAP